MGPMEQRASAIDVVRGFPGLRVLVVGDAMLDTWLEGDAIRLCKEAPVPVVREASTTRCAGGAANTAANLAALGAEVSFVSLVGRDSAGDHLRQALREAGIDDAGLVEDGAVSSLHKLRVIANGQYVVRFDEGDTEQVSERSRNLLLGRIADMYARCDAVVVSDYCHGAVCDEVIRRLIQLRERGQKVIVVDSKEIARFSDLQATMVTPNLREAQRAVDPSGSSGLQLTLAAASEIGTRLRPLLRADQIAVTMANEGVLLIGPAGEQTHLPCHAVERAGDVGAGDTFTAAAALALATGATAAQAVRVGIDSASIAVTRSRTSVVSYQDLLRRVSLDDNADTLSLKDVVARLEAERFLGKRIVFTNGVFDILHAGHVQLLRRARALGDVLVVGLNSDASTRRLKGPTRPVNRESDRIALVSALDAVDYAVLFDEDTPAELIRAIRPHVHVKGGDYLAEFLPEIEAVHEVGAEVEILSLVTGRSTTALIDRIVATVTAASDGAGRSQ
jgi:D-beta-D-heptose 7-phosphate kinase / D-beta-D-heptose 1-phosphate adenosyltransferase